MSVKVTEPGGTTVRIGRRWLPWRRRLRHLDDLDVPDVPLGDDPISAVIAVIMLVIALPFIALFAIALGELLLLLAVLPLALLVRVAFGRPWTVDVTRQGELVLSERAPDWPSSTELIHDLAAKAERGDLLSR